MSSARSGVLGFTEAELGLFLALLFMGVAAYGSGTSSPPEPAARVLSADSSRMAIVARMAAERDSLARITATLGQRVTALGTSEAQLAGRRDSLAALPRSTVSAILARRMQLGDSILRALDSIRVARAATSAEQRMMADRRDALEARLEPMVREEATIMSTVATARRERDSVLRVAGPGDSAVVQRYAQRLDSLSEIAGNPARRASLAQAPTIPVVSSPEEVLSASPGKTTSAGVATGTRTASAQGPTGTGRSNQTPSCTELGVASGEIATVTILERNRFRVRGEEGNMQIVLTALATEQQAADRAKCRHVVRVTTVPGLSVDSYVPALVELRRFFNTTLIGPGE